MKSVLVSWRTIHLHIRSFIARNWVNIVNIRVRMQYTFLILKYLLLLLCICLFAGLLLNLFV